MTEEKTLKDLSIIKEIAKKWIEDNSVNIYIIKIYNDSSQRSVNLYTYLWKLQIQFNKKYGPINSFSYELEFDYAFIKSTSRETISHLSNLMSKKGFEVS